MKRKERKKWKEKKKKKSREMKIKKRTEERKGGFPDQGSKRSEKGKRSNSRLMKERE